MKELDLYLKLEKCSFNVSEVEYLRMIVKPGSLAMDPIKVAGIADWPIPSTVRDVWSFLGFANFYQHFIPHYSDTACPLLDLTKKTHPWSWDQSCNDAFTALKAAFNSQPVLHLPDLSAPLPFPLMPPNMLLEEFFCKKTSITSGILVLICPRHLALLSATTTTMTGNCSPS